MTCSSFTKRAMVLMGVALSFLLGGCSTTGFRLNAGLAGASPSIRAGTPTSTALPGRLATPAAVAPTPVAGTKTSEGPGPNGAGKQAMPLASPGTVGVNVAGDRPAMPPPEQVAGPCTASGCHSDLHKDDERYKHKPYADGRCLDCHKGFHTADTQRKRLQMELDLCYSCHPRRELGITHPVGDGVIDPTTGQTMTCTSTCHRAHSAPYEYLLTRSGKGALCVVCHKDLLDRGGK
jgi:predicted CXXCH cytochrome family protein